MSRCSNVEEDLKVHGKTGTIVWGGPKRQRRKVWSRMVESWMELEVVGRWGGRLLDYVGLFEMCFWFWGSNRGRILPRDVDIGIKIMGLAVVIGVGS